MNHLRQSILKGVLSGISAWLVYGVAEAVLAYALPKAFWKPEMEVAVWQSRLIASILGVYALAGLLFGAIAGGLLACIGKSDSGHSHRILASLSLIAAFVANLIQAWPLARSEEVAAGIAVVWIAILAAALMSERWQRRAAFATGPWTVSLVLLAAPWVSREVLHDRNAVVKLGVSLCAIAAVVAISAALHTLLRERRVSVRRSAIAASALAVLFAIGIQMPRTRTVRAEQPPGPAATRGPNVVLITMDTVRADHLSVYGYAQETTPHLQAFAREATVYNRAIAAGDFTLPSHASIFTGVYPSWHGAYPAHPEYSGGRPLAPGATTVAGILRARGYWTGGIFANAAFLQASTGLDQGFSLWSTGTPAALTDLQRPFYLRESARKLLTFAVNTSEFDALFFRASDVNSRAFAVLEQLRTRGQFFLFLNYMDAHYPYVPPAPFHDRFARLQPDSKAVAAYNELKSSVNAAKRRIRDVERSALIAQYDAGIAYVDSQIANLLTRLRELGLYENTLILITSDHGEAFGDHNTIGHTVTSVFQDGAHIPLLVKYPRQHEGSRSDALVSHVDIMPTILDAVRCPLPPALQGQTLRLPRSVSDVVFSEARAIGDHESDARLRGVRRAAVSGSSKLVTWSAGSPEFYDLAADPGELTNRYRPDDPLAASLMARMTAWTATIPRQLPKPAKLDKSTMDRIRSLGYTQ